MRRIEIGHAMAAFPVGGSTETLAQAAGVSWSREELITRALEQSGELVAGFAHGAICPHAWHILQSCVQHLPWAAAHRKSVARRVEGLRDPKAALPSACKDRLSRRRGGTTLAQHVVTSGSSTCQSMQAAAGAICSMAA